MDAGDIDSSECRKYVRCTPMATELAAEPPNYGAFLRQAAEDVSSMASPFASENEDTETGRSRAICTPLLVNLGPVWRNPTFFQSWGASMTQCSDFHWETPPGLGLAPLHVIVDLCARIHEHLIRSPHAIVLLHSFTCSKTGSETVAFFAACHLIFSRNYTSVNEALSDIYRSDSTCNGNSNSLSSIIDLQGSREQFQSRDDKKETTSSTRFVLNRRRLLPGQRRYCEYLSWILYSPELIPNSGKQVLRLTEITFHKLSVFGKLNTAHPRSDESWNPAVISKQVKDTVSQNNAIRSWSSDHINFESRMPPEQLLLSIFSGGKEIWSGGVTPGSINDEEDIISFDIHDRSHGDGEGVPIFGDIIVALRTDDHYSSVMWKPPKIAYAFHSAFVAICSDFNAQSEKSMLRVSASDLDVPGNNESKFLTPS